jgi:hypothetical protein
MLNWDDEELLHNHAENRAMTPQEVTAGYLHFRRECERLKQEHERTWIDLLSLVGYREMTSGIKVTGKTVVGRIADLYQAQAQLIAVHQSGSKTIKEWLEDEQDIVRRQRRAIDRITKLIRTPWYKRLFVNVGYEWDRLLLRWRV